ncbi:hypothetical protein [Solicola sp. PLA-1-18]|uniref:hypothetical protein n=1 Tax=Solicola sp. PLA-1-18 TaxID=3380532 RepID=UPI003B7CA5DF
MRRVLVSIVLAVLVVGLSAGPSAAQTKARKDGVGEVPRRIDISSVKVQDNAENLAVTVRLRTVQPRRTAVLVDLTPRRGDYYFVYSLPTGKRSYMVQLRVFPAEAERDHAVDCPRLSVRWDQGRRGFARFVVPQSCLSERGRIMQTSVQSIDAGDLGGRAVPRAARGHGDDMIESDGLGKDGVGFISTRRG